MTQLQLIKQSLTTALRAIADAERDIALFQPMANMGDETAADMIAESTGNAADAILELYQEIGKHAPSLKVISNQI